MIEVKVIKVPRESDGRAKSVFLQGGGFEVCFYFDKEGKMKEARKIRIDGKPVLCEDDLCIYPVLKKAFRRKAYAILSPKKKS